MQWLVKSKVVTDAMEQVWHGVSQMKSSVTKLIDSDNDGWGMLFIDSLFCAVNGKQYLLSVYTVQSFFPKKKYVLW